MVTTTAVMLTMVMIMVTMMMTEVLLMTGNRKWRYAHVRFLVIIQWKESYSSQEHKHEKEVLSSVVNKKYFVLTLRGILTMTCDHFRLCKYTRIVLAKGLGRRVILLDWSFGVVWWSTGHLPTCTGGWRSSLNRITHSKENITFTSSTYDCW